MEPSAKLNDGSCLSIGRLLPHKQKKDGDREKNWYLLQRTAQYAARTALGADRKQRVTRLLIVNFDVLRSQLSD